MSEQPAENGAPPVCDHNCDPMAPESRRLDATHYLDCPVWTWLGVTRRGDA